MPSADERFACDVNISAHHRNVAEVPVFHDGRGVELTYAAFFAVYIRREVIDAIPRDRGRIADTVIPSMALIEQMAERRAPIPAFAPTSRAAKCYEQLWAEVDDG